MRTYQTWEVVKALTQYSSWHAFSPETDALYPTSAFNDGDGAVVFCYHGAEPSLDQTQAAAIRDDWRLYDASGNEVTDYE